MSILETPYSAIFSRITLAMPSAGSTAVTCDAFWAKGMASVPGPAPMSRTRDAAVISVSQTVLSMRLRSCRHIFQKRSALSRLSQMRAQSRPGLDSRFPLVRLFQTSFQSISFRGSFRGSCHENCLFWPHFLGSLSMDAYLSPFPRTFSSGAGPGSGIMHPVF